MPSKLSVGVFFLYILMRNSPTSLVDKTLGIFIKVGNHLL
jgi:hypothetical protein